jgi:hypothetical protein
MNLKLLSLTLVSFVLFSCVKNEEVFTKNEIVEHANDLGIAQNNLYFIKPELQAAMIEKGQPNSVVLDKKLRKLVIGTCYEEYPFFMDEFFKVKAQLIDSLEMYDLKQQVDLKALFAEFEANGESPMEIDPSKKYYHFYYFANYAQDMDKKLQPAIEKYQDSVQFFFINIDKVKE